MAGETSLARQLQQLAAPQTSLLLQNKVRASLLFDPKEASSLDRDAVYEFGITGFDKLVILNSDLFLKFERLLFNEYTKTFERSVHIQSINKKLDETVDNFLVALSPYALLRGAHEALEWLVYRFHIHMFNVDSLISCVLPHYNSRIFVRVLQLIDLSSPTSQWHWLLPTKKSGEPLKFAVLMQQFNADLSFRKLVCKLALKSISTFRDDLQTCQPVVSFSIVTTYYAIKKCTEISEDFVSFLVPYITKGLKLYLPALHSGIYAVISVLVSKSKLNPDLVDSLLRCISKSLLPSILMQGLELIVLICELQDVKMLPEIVFDELSSKTVLPVLYDLLRSFGDMRFSRLMMKKAIIASFKSVLSEDSSGRKNKAKLVANLIRTMELNKYSVKVCFNSVMKFHKKYHKYASKRSKKKLKKINGIGKLILNHMETFWPTHFDLAIESHFKKGKNSNDKIKWKLLSRSITSVRHTLVPDSGVTLLLAMNHSNSTIRLHAVEVIASLIESNEIKDVEFIQKSLLDRICDDDPRVSLKILSMKNKLKNILPMDKFMDTLIYALKRNDAKPTLKQRQVKLNVLKALCSLYNSPVMFNTRLLEAVFPFLFPNSVEDLCFTECVIKSNICGHPLFNSVGDEISRAISQFRNSRKKEGLKDLHCIIWKNIIESIKLAEESEKSLLNKFVFKSIDMLQYNMSFCFGVVLVTQALVGFEKGRKIKARLLAASLDKFTKLMSSERLGSDVFTGTDFDSVISLYTKATREGKYPITLICYCISEIIESLSWDDFTLVTVAENVWWPDIGKTELETNRFFETYINFFVFLIEHLNSRLLNIANSFKLLVGSFLKHVLETPQKIIWFLSFIFSNVPFQSFKTVDCVSALKMAHTLCRSSKSFCSGFFESFSVNFFALLLSISSEDPLICEEAFNLLQSVLAQNDDSVSHYKVFSEMLNECRDEIKLDRTRFYHDTGLWLFSTNTTTSEPGVVIAAQKMHSDLVTLIQANTTPLYITHLALKMLQKDDSEKLFLSILPVLKRLLSESKEKSQPLPIVMNILDLLIKKYSPSVARGFQEDGQQLEFFIQLLQGNASPEINTKQLIQNAALSVLSKEFFNAIPSVSVQRRLLDVLVCMSIDLKSTDVNSIVSSVLKKLSASAYLLLKELPDNGGVALKEVSSLKEVKKSRNQQKVIANVGAVDSIPWKKVIIMLEKIQNKKNLNDKVLLIAELFRLLNITLDWETQPSIEYVRQLILSSISNCCKQLGAEGLEEEKFQVELVIQCIRVTDNPKTHQQALLLLNLAAVFFPDYVLNNIMSIFTFMGSSLIRQDDSYSFQVISQTIETIIPALQQATKQKNEDVTQVMAAVTRMFVDSVPDIPRHRQLSLFTKLINTLGPSEYLWIPLGQICERYAYPSKFYKVYISKSKEKNLAPTLEFAVILRDRFSIIVQLETCLKLLEHVHVLPNVIDEETKSACGSSKEPFNLCTHSTAELQDYKKNILCYVNLWLSSPEFLSLIVETKSKNIFEQHYETLLKTTLDYLQNVSENDFAVENSNYRNEILHLLYDFLNSINSLLPCNLFISVTKKLLKKPLLDIQLKAMEILNSRMEHQSKFFESDTGLSDLLKLLRPILKILRCEGSIEEDFNNKKKVELNQQTALYSLHLMCKLTGDQFSEKFIKVLPVVVEILCDETKHSNLLINSLLCIAELCKCLNAHVLPYLSTFMTQIMKLMEDNISLKNGYLVCGLVAALKGLVHSLGAFVSPYIDSILFNVCLILEKSNENSLQLLKEQGKSLCHQISTEVAPRILFASVKKVCEKFLGDANPAISVLVSVFAESISNTDHNDLQEYIPNLRDLFLLLLGFRDCNKDSSLSVVNRIEQNIVDSFFSLTLKLSESTFQVVYSGIHKWAVPVVFEKNEEENKNRVLTFYHLTYELAKNLKMLFTPCAKKVFRHAASILNSTNSEKSETLYFGNQDESEEKTILLVTYVIDAISLCFSCDDSQLGTQEVFDLLMQPLVDQIENQLGGDNIYQDRIENHLSTCLANFIVTFPDSTMWKAFNYQVLLKTRHSSSKVRFASLKVIREVVKKMSDNYLVLLPESIPFLAEIMEDESYEVEKECQDALVEMEKILGEPIKKYF